jgi:predicted DNA-binding antitoxin AbrB/MazE fold protein
MARCPSGMLGDAKRDITMIIHAVYENGVFRPTDPVTLPENCPVALVVHQESAAKSQSDGTAPLTKLAALAGAHPENPALPSDLAAQHDHYLYGTPKR